MTGTLFDPQSAGRLGVELAEEFARLAAAADDPTSDPTRVDCERVLPRVLALDLSIRASGICDHRGHLSTFSPMAEGDDRLVDITRHVLDAAGCVIGDTGPAALHADLVAMEGPVLRSASALALGMLHGAVRSELIRRGIPYLVVAPAQIKTYATGKGNGKGTDKAGMAVALHKRTGLDPQDENQVDAKWLHLLVLDLLGHPVIELPQSHRRALDKLKVPAGYQPPSG